MDGLFGGPKLGWVKAGRDEKPFTGFHPNSRGGRGGTREGKFWSTDIRYRFRDVGDIQGMPGLEDVEDRGEGPFSDDEESSSDDEETAEGKSYDSPSAVLGSGERQVRGGVQIDTPSPKLGPQLGGAPSGEEDLGGGLQGRQSSPSPGQHRWGLV